VKQTVFILFFFWTNIFKSATWCRSL